MNARHVRISRQVREATGWSNTQLHVQLKRLSAAARAELGAELAEEADELVDGDGSL